jgi:hypothetical protein
MNRLLPRLCLLALSVPLAGCAGNVSGDIDGTTGVSFTDSFFAWMPEAGNGDERMQIIATTFGGACDAHAQAYDRLTEIIEDVENDTTAILQNPDLNLAEKSQAIDDRVEEGWDAVSDEYPEYFPEQYWELRIELRAESKRDFEDERFDFPGDGSFRVCNHTEYPDFYASTQTDTEEERQEALGMECFDAEDGDLRFSAFDDEGAVQASGDAELEDADDDNAGEVDFGFGAAWCEDYEDEIN